MILALLACRPYEPPPVPPALTRAQAHHFVRADDPTTMLVRAGSAFDPPGREGLAWAAAHAVATGIGAEVRVGPELVEFSRAGLAVGAATRGPPARDCAGRAEDVFATRFWAGHPYGHPVWGRSSVLPTISDLEIAQFVDRWYVNPAIAIVGPADVTLPAPARLATAPTPTVLPKPRPGTVFVDGESACLVFGTAGDGPRTAEEWALVARLRAQFGDTRRIDPTVEPGFTVAVALPEGPSVADHVRTEIAALVAGGPSWSTGGITWAPGVPALLPLTAFDGTFSDAHTILARWLGGGRTRMVVVAPAAEYPPGTDVLSYTEITR